MEVVLCPSIWYLTLISFKFDIIKLRSIDGHIGIWHQSELVGKVFCSNIFDLYVFFFILPSTSGWCHPWWVSWPCRLYWRGSFGWGPHCQVLSSFFFLRITLSPWLFVFILTSHFEAISYLHFLCSGSYQSERSLSLVLLFFLALPSPPSSSTPMKMALMASLTSRLQTNMEEK